MKQVDISLKAGSRGFICGRSGSGKTTLALRLCEGMPSPLVILDTKYDPDLKKWAKSLGIPIETKRMPEWRHIKSDVVIRPPADWIAHPEDIDWWLGQAFTCRYVPSIYLDEGYQCGAGTGRLGQGVSGLWTRGRAFGFRSLIGTQRPAFISRFVISESDQLYVGLLIIEDDRVKIFKDTGQPRALEMQPDHRFLFIRQNGSEPVQLKPLDIGASSLYDAATRNITRRKLRR